MRHERMRVFAKPRTIRVFIFTILAALLLIHSTNGNTDSAPLDPGTAVGTLSVDGQTFRIKHAYAKKTKDPKDDSKETAFLVLLTDRNFPEDLSKLDRLDLNRFIQRHDLHGIALGIDENQRMFFIDILRLTSITGAAEYKPSSNKPGSVEGRIYTKGEQRYLNHEFEFDITFKAQP